MKLRLLKSYQYIYDLDKNTLDGEPVQLSDLILMLGHYSHDHPEDEHIKKVLALWAYGRDNPVEATE